MPRQSGPVIFLTYGEIRDVADRRKAIPPQSRGATELKGSITVATIFPLCPCASVVNIFIVFQNRNHRLPRHLGTPEVQSNDFCEQILVAWLAQRSRTSTIPREVARTSRAMTV
jgi:hypothetical protein